MSDGIDVMELEATVCAHRMIEERSFFRSRLICVCGYRSKKYMRGTFWPTMRAHLQAHHWETVMEIGGFQV